LRQKFNLTATQAILYFDSMAPGDTIALRYRLRAKYPIRARAFQSRVYEYYDPDVSSLARPVQLEVRKRAGRVARMLTHGGSEKTFQASLGLFAKTF
jgi:A-macroglobulin receptor binding domain